MRSLIPSPVYDFLEFAAINKKYKVNPNTLYLSKVMFRKGQWETLLNQHLEECECSINNEDNRLYVVTWVRNGQELCVVGIPIEYELLANDRRRNMERVFVDELGKHQIISKHLVRQSISEDELKIYGTEGLFVLEGRSYLLPELNQNVYYVLKNITETRDTLIKGELQTESFEAVVPCVVIDSEHPAETFANLVLANDEILPEVTIKLDFHLSDYHRREIIMPLNNLKDFLKIHGCSIFFANSAKVKDTQRAVLLAHNAAKGYNHLFSLRIDNEQLTTAHPQIEAAVYLYIPPIDKDHLFGKTPMKKSGAKIY